VHRPGHIPHAFDAFRRLFAAGCAALVLALGAMAANPALHALAHAGDAPCEQGDHRHESLPTDSAGVTHVCAVTLFAQGLALAAPISALPATPAIWHELIGTSVEEPLLTAPRLLHAPPCGPPLV
jgi:hypothetical protein